MYQGAYSLTKNDPEILYRFNKVSWSALNSHKKTLIAYNSLHDQQDKEKLSIKKTATWGIMTSLGDLISSTIVKTPRKCK